MFVPLTGALLAVPLAVQLIAAATPNLDVRPSCRGAAQAGYIASTEDRLKLCLDSEQRTREQIDKAWSSFPAADRAYCAASSRGFEPTYTELATCLEMQRDVRKIRAAR